MSTVDEVKRWRGCVILIESRCKIANKLKTYFLVKQALHTTVGFVLVNVDGGAGFGHLVSKSVDAPALRLSRGALHRLERSIFLARHWARAQRRRLITLILTHSLHCIGRHHTLNPQKPRPRITHMLCCNGAFSALTLLVRHQDCKKN